MEVGKPEAIGATPERSHYFWVARDTAKIGLVRVMSVNACLQHSGIPRSTEALEVGSLQQLGVLPLGLLQTGNVRGSFFPDTSVAISSPFNLSLFPGLIRSTDMIGHLFMTWEASVGVESEVAQLRRGEPTFLILEKQSRSLSESATQILHCLSVGG